MRSRKPPKHRIELAPDVALVVFEWLEHHEERDWAGVPFNHPGELEALSRLGGALQTVVTETFDPRYGELLAAARERLASEALPVDE